MNQMKTNQMEQKVANCLSLSGGGCKGLLQIHQLNYLYSLYGAGVFRKNFDFIAGTSTGALITALLSLDFSPQDALSIYNKELPKIFKKGTLRFGIFRPKYDNEYLRGLARELLGNNRLGDCKTNILIPAYNSDKDRATIFKSNDPRDKDFLLYEVVLASAAAPTYFAPIKIKGEFYKDGGISYNNPSDIVSKEARAAGHDVVNILSITTGSTKGATTRAEVKGGITGAKVTVNDMLREQDITTHNNVTYDYEHYYKNKGLYLRAESVIKHSSGKIDDVSERNIENMNLDGELSVSANKKLLSLFYLNSQDKEV